MHNLFRVMHDRLKLRGWIALCLIVATVVWLPQLLPTRFVTERRAASSLQRAQAHLASGEFDQARAEFRAALRLQPGDGEARRQLAAVELRLGQWELAFLEFQSLARATECGSGAAAHVPHPARRSRPVASGAE